MKIGAPTREELAELEAKYAQIVELRHSHERGEPLPERAVFKALAERYPGVLRELDTLPMEVVETRRQSLAAAMAGGVVEPWMAWMVAYHRLLRAALWIKVSAAKQPDLTNERVVSLAGVATEVFEFYTDEQFVLNVVHPPAGRLNAVVMERLEVMFGVPVAEIREALFPRRRK
jgi:hypothetical protein